jgi:hypothetical protein
MLSRCNGGGEQLEHPHLPGDLCAACVVITCKCGQRARIHGQHLTQHAHSTSAHTYQQLVATAHAHHCIFLMTHNKQTPTSSSSSLQCSHSRPCCPISERQRWQLPACSTKAGEAWLVSRISACRTHTQDAKWCAESVNATTTTTTKMLGVQHQCFLLIPGCPHATCA